MHWFLDKIYYSKDIKELWDDFLIDGCVGRGYTYYSLDWNSSYSLRPGRIHYVAPKLSFWSICDLLSAINSEQIATFDKDIQNYYPIMDKVQCGVVLTTSGSSGKPKRILHDLDKLLEAHRHDSKALRTIAFLKFDHIGGLNTVLYTLSAGGALIVPASLGVVDVCHAIEKYKAELLPTTPSFLNLLLASGMADKYDLSSLKIISFGTEPMPDELLKRLRAKFPNVQLKQLYGMSEIGILSNKTNPDNPNYFKLRADTKIIDGKLYIKSPTTMVGYLDKVDNNSPIMCDGWLDTGDLVEEKDGYIRIIGREDDVINVGGQKVYPSEVENVIMQCPLIKDVAVYGEDSPMLGQIVVCKIVPPDTVDISLTALKQFCTEHLDKYKIPMKFKVVEQIAISERGKKRRK